MAENFQRHRQLSTHDGMQKLHCLDGKGMSLEAISNAMTRSEESIEARAKQDGLKVLLRALSGLRTTLKRRAYSPWLERRFASSS